MTTDLETKPKPEDLIIPDDCLMRRGFIDNVSVREVNEKEHSAVFVAATENGVRTYNGMEYLDMDGIDLERYLKNPTLLDAHNRFETLDTIGKTEIVVENYELIAKTIFATTNKANEIYKLVKDDFVRMLSIGYIIRRMEPIEEGDEVELHGKTIHGPAVIGRKWELYEISTVSVGADPDALKRGLEDMDINSLKDFLKRLTSFVDNKEKIMAKDKTKTQATPADQAPETPAVPETPEVPEDSGRSAAAPEDSEKRKREIYAITPRGLEPVADACVLDGLTVEQSKSRLKDELAKKMVPVGTPHSEESDAGPKGSAAAAAPEAPQTKEKKAADDAETERSIFTKKK